jgi:hypothetical protein
MIVIQASTVSNTGGGGVTAIPALAPVSQRDQIHGRLSVIIPVVFVK